MASFQRVALYIMFDAIEHDIVSKIRSLSCSEIVLTDEEKTKAESRLSGREDLGYDLKNPFDLLYGLDLGEKFQVLLRHKSSMEEGERNYYTKLNDTIARSIQIRNHIMHGRQLTLNEHVFALDLAQDLLRNRAFWPTLHRRYLEYTDDPTSFVEGSVRFLDDPSYSEVLHNLPVPDYDDTGFLPRPALERDLKKKILGRHPAVTVLGEGGNGKTALALRVLYGLVQSNDHNFDAIIWVSAKTAELSVAGIREIESVATSAVQLMDQAATLEPGDGTPAERLDRLLRDNRTLLVIDNYETVIGDDLATLAQDVPGESKLLFTSRLPVGGDLTVLVDELPPDDAFIYFKRLIQAYGVDSLSVASEDHVRRLLERLSYKPLLIKWLVLGVKSGLDADRISLSPDTALRFCLDNVILTLGNEAQAVIVVLASLPSSSTASVIQHVSRLTPIQVTDGLAELSRFGLVDIEITNHGEKTYSVKQFSRTYISRLISPRPELVELITRSYFALDAEFTSERNTARYNPYSMKTFKVGSRSRMVIAKKLKEAASLAANMQFELSEQVLLEAKGLDPTYFEAHRVESFIAQQQRDWNRALSAMETAISIAPDEPQLYFYAGGLLLRLNENDRAAEYLERSHQLDPDETIILREIARNEMIRCNFERARKFIQLCKLKRHTPKNVVILLDLELQLYVREAEFLTAHADFEGATKAMADLLHFLNELPSSAVDSRMNDHLSRAGKPLRMLEDALGTVEPLESVRRLVSDKFPDAGILATPRKPGEFYGKMREAGRTETFGFLHGSRGIDTFVHRKSASPLIWEYMTTGGLVAFDVEPFEGRERACNISRVVEADEVHESDESVTINGLTSGI